MTSDDISDEDKALFRKMVGAVTPVKNGQYVFEEKQRPQALTRRKTVITSSETQQYPLSNHYQTEITSEARLAYARPGIARKRLVQLRQGKMPIEARLDLHGLNPEEASRALCAFIDTQGALGHRCVLIIHGKGGRRGGLPILKNHVNHWLQQLPQILAFCSAQPRDGGSGALYVLLAKC